MEHMKLIVMELLELPTLEAVGEGMNQKLQELELLIHGQ